MFKKYKLRSGQFAFENLAELVGQRLRRRPSRFCKRTQNKIVRCLSLLCSQDNGNENTKLRFVETSARTNVSPKTKSQSCREIGKKNGTGIVERCVTITRQHAKNKMEIIGKEIHEIENNTQLLRQLLFSIANP